MYRGYRCRFDSVIAVTEATDISDPVATSNTVTVIDKMLDDGVKEDADAAGEDATDLAYLPINGSLVRLQYLLERATESRAPEAFLAVLRRAISEATKAYEAATRRHGPGGTNGSGNGGAAATPQAWTKDAPVNLGPDIQPSDIE